MKQILSLVASALIGLSAVAAMRVDFKVATDHADCLYRCGETAAFTVTVTDRLGKPLKQGRFDARLDNFGHRVIRTEQIDLAKGNPFTLKAKMEEPGFLRLTVTSADKNLVINRYRNLTSLVWGVAYEPEKIRPGASDPADFDAWWAAQVKKLDATVPIDVRMDLVPAKSKGACNYYAISFATCQGRRVYGWLSRPKNLAKGPYPVGVSVPGAGIGACGTDIAAGRVSLTLNVHSYPQPGNAAARQAAYAAQDAKFAAPLGVGRYCVAGISKSREDYFYYASLLGINRAVNWLWSQPWVDKRHFTYQGTSQGGGFGFMLTGLNGHFTRSCIYVPAITDLLGFRQGDRQSGWPQLTESQTPEGRATAEKWAPYYDGVNFAARITCPVRVVAGFADCTCSPAAVYAAYNRIPSKDKKILHGIGMSHSVFGHFYRDLGRWQRER